MAGPTLSDNAHDEAEALLPWYATGRLDPSDRALVEAHLSSCPNCQRQLKTERLLIDEFRSLSPEIDTGWSRLRAQIEPEQQKRATFSPVFGEIWDVFRRPAVAALAAAQIAFVIIAGAVLLSLNRPAYQALGSADTPQAANVLVIFQADATEEDVREALRASGASIVGGPTAADAYLLHVPANRRADALARLQSDDNVQLAQPIDGAAQ
jgi:anti-sigma factor RsiW